jgi:polysaccharide deacetylase family protein (PEP-CTERM system associated)
MESRLPQNLDRLLKLLDDYGRKATFFTLGWVAERYPELVADVHQRGHEVGSHGYWHEPLTSMSPTELGRDLQASREAISAACGVEPLGYRAPGFSITSENLWALDVIKDAGFTYDSSLLTCAHPHGGQATHDGGPHVLTNGLVEIPVSTTRLLSKRVPLGGGFLRVMGRRSLRRRLEMAAKTGEPMVSYVHPADCDGAQPRLKLPLWRYFKNYVALNRTKGLLEVLLTDGQHMTMAELSNKVIEDEMLTDCAPKEGLNLGEGRGEQVSHSMTGGGGLML